MGLLSFLGKKYSNYEHEILSPNRRVRCVFALREGHVCYEVERDGKPIVRESYLGLELMGELPLGKKAVLVRVHERAIDEEWETQWGEERLVRNQCQETTFYLSEDTDDRRLMTIRFRVFDDGVAFRYEIPPQPKFRRLAITDEMTEFKVEPNGYAWKIPAYQPDRYEYNYERVAVYELTESVHTPLTIQTPTGVFLSIHEAALYDYGGMTLKLDKWHALKTDITPLSDGVRAYIDLPFNTPWRVIMMHDTAIGLTTNRMILNLNDPPAHDFSWVKPIKFMGIWWAMYVGEWTWAPGERHGATTEHAKEYIDACKRLGVGGLLVEGWNVGGWEGDWLQSGAHSSFVEAVSDFNLPEVAKYAKDNGVELMGHHETVGFVDNYEKQLAEAYEYYAENNVHYIKSGYAGSMMTIQGRKEYHHSQIGVKHYQKALELAAKYHIMLNVHEPIKGTGIERTWPNVLTREGARGQEYEGGALEPSHACILPFTRLLAGGMDYTSGIFDVTNSTKRLASTLARQLAYYVTIFSGAQMVSDRPRFYEEKYPEAYKFICDVPVSWEKTVPLMGKIGEYFVVARKERGGEDWFVGGVTNAMGRRARLVLDFLEQGEYLAEIYRDANDAHYRDNQLAIDIESKMVTAEDALDLWMAPGGGFAIRFIKKS